MATDTQLIARLQQRCVEYGIGHYEALRPVIQDQLLKLEQYFLNTIEQQRRIAEERKLFGKLSVMTASSHSQVQRSSIYNNPNTLKHYIEMRIAEINEMDILGTRERNNIEQNSRDVEKCIDGFRVRLVEAEALRLQINDLERELSNLKAMYNTVLENNFRLQSDLDALQRKSKSNVQFLRNDSGS